MDNQTKELAGGIGLGRADQLQSHAIYAGAVWFSPSLLRLVSRGSVAAGPARHAMHPDAIVEWPAMHFAFLRTVLDRCGRVQGGKTRST